MFEMGAKLEEFLLDKKEKMVIVKEIKAKNEHQLVFKFEKRKGKPTTLVGRFYLEDKIGRASCRERL